jgi:aspartyl-tRNA(Asn)/glutamyl-tRNA(Gln) amidotransferase subunit C
MHLTPDDLRRIAMLARIEVQPQELTALGEQLDRIFGLIEQMQSVDTRGVEPMPHAQAVHLRLREDRVTEADRRIDFQSIAPQVESGLYLVPKVIE